MNVGPSRSHEAVLRLAGAFLLSINPLSFRGEIKDIFSCP